MRLHLTRACGSISLFGCVALLMLAGCKDDPGPRGAISITLERSALDIPQSRTDSVFVYLTRVNGYASNVALAVEGLPAGVTHAFSTASLPSGTPWSKLYLTVGSSASAGTYPLTIRARGSGVDEQAANIQLTIVANPPTMALSISPTARTVPPGESGTATVTITRGGTFVTPVNLTAESVPANVTVTFSPATIPAGAVTSSVTITVGASAAHGQHAITVRARGDGVTDQLATLVLTIATSGFAIAATPSVIAVQAGASAYTAVSIVRTGGFTGPVHFSIENAPNGVAGAFIPNPATTHRRADLSLTVDANVPPGDYDLNVRASSPGVSGAVASVTLRVVSGGAAGNITFRFCNGLPPIWVATQDDAGPWVRVPAGPSDTYSFNITARGGVALVRPAGSGFELQVMYATAAELANAGSRWACWSVSGSKQLSGTLAGVAGQEAGVSLGPRLASINAAQDAYTLRNVPNGPLDLTASRGTSDYFSYDINRLIIRRGLDLPDGGVIPLLDFASSEAVATVPSTLTLANAATDELVWFISYRTAGGTDEMLNAAFYVQTTSIPYDGVPSSVQQAGDLHEIFLIADGSDVLRGVSTGFHTAQPRTLTLGPPVSMPVTQVASATPYLRYRMTLAAQPEYGGLAAAWFSQPTPYRETEIYVSSAYLGATPNQWEITVPDLTAAADFDPQWGLQAGVATEVSAHARNSSLLLPRPGEGETIRWATRLGSAPLTPARKRSLGGVTVRQHLERLRVSRMMTGPLMTRQWTEPWR